MIATYTGLGVRASNLMDQYTTLASLRAGVNISDRNRSFQLAMAEFNTLKEYNDYQLRSRNWNQLIDDVPENRWNWTSESDRNHYNELRSNRESVKNQMPAIAALMVLNRVMSAVNAYSRAREISSAPEVAVTPVPAAGETGFVATFRFSY